MKFAGDALRRHAVERALRVRFRALPDAAHSSIDLIGAPFRTWLRMASRSNFRCNHSRGRAGRSPSRSRAGRHAIILAPFALGRRSISPLSCGRRALHRNRAILRWAAPSTLRHRMPCFP